jgi:Rod binding domain-containing protein
MDISSMASMASQTPAVAAPKATGDAAKADWAAKEYESVFISQFLGSMFSGIKTDGITGGGQGEEMFRSLMVNEYAKGLQQRGGFGLAAQMKAQLLKHQEVAAQ